MPLTKSPSKQAFQKNIKAEVKAGKPVKQATPLPRWLTAGSNTFAAPLVAIG